MYNPPKFMSVALLSGLLTEFTWPAPYTVEDCLPDGIAVNFPECTLYFTEGFESDMNLKFLPEHTGLNRSVTVTQVLVAVRSVRELPDVSLIDDPNPYASPDKVRNGIRDLCTLVLAYFRPTVLGDFGWVETYRDWVVRTQSQQAQ